MCKYKHLLVYGNLALPIKGAVCVLFARHDEMRDAVSYSLF